MRVAVMELLASDPEMNAMGINADRIWPNFAFDRQPQRDDQPWLILRWGATSVAFGGPSSRVLNIWAYKARQISTDHRDLDAPLARALTLLCDAVHYVGSDGGVIHQARFAGFSEDLVDEGYDAIARSLQMQVNGSDG